MEDLPQLTGPATVVMVVNGASITISVDGTNAPITSGNFVDLVERGFYNQISFHRVVREPNPFVVQAGDPQSRDPNFPADLLGTGGFIDPVTGQERRIPLEIKPVGAAEPIYSQTFEDAGITTAPLLRNVRSAIAMARVGDNPDSASSQFFVNLADNPFLDGDFAVFGNVTQGMDVVDQIQQGNILLYAGVTEGIISGRVSSLITDAVLLNNLVNASNAIKVPVLTNSRTDGNEVIQLTTSDRGILALDGIDSVVGSDNSDVVNGNLGDDIIEGGAGDDFIRGGQGNDILIGSSGNDYLVGDLGLDILAGGDGADTFIFRTFAAVPEGDVTAADRISDFNAGQGDRVAIAGEIGLTDLVFNVSGNDTLIQLTNGDILGLVQNAATDIVRSATFIVSSNDLAMTIG
ncbi:MAG: peptidylprolyl isomerase [Hormoscilla sp.]